MGCRKWSRRRKRFRSCKDDGGNNQGPKIELFALSKWMCFVGRFPASVDAEKQEPSVCGVNRRRTPSESIPELPENEAAVNFAAAITISAVSAPAMAWEFWNHCFCCWRAEPSGPAVTERLLWDWFDRFGAESVSLTSFEELSRPSRALRKGL